MPTARQPPAIHANHPPRQPPIPPTRARLPIQSQRPALHAGAAYALPDEALRNKVPNRRRKQMRVGFMSGEEDAEYDRLYPKVLWRGKLYRIHKSLGKDQVRLVTMDHETIFDVPINEVTAQKAAPLSEKICT
jgi:hypothetical protein